MARILVVEDREELRVLVRTFLEADGHKVTTAEDGERAWRLLETERFNVVVTDFQMPLMDGMELCHRIKTSPLLEGRRPHVVLMSGEAVHSSHADIVLHKGGERFRKDLSRAVTSLLI